MKGAIFYSGKYGSTKQYAQWIGEASGFPIFDIKDPGSDPSKYELVILGSSIIYFKLSIRKWLSENLSALKGRSKILFSVSGAGPSAKLNRWVANSLPVGLADEVEHIALRGRLDHSKVSWWIRSILWMGSLFNPDPEASKDERYGFDYVDKDSIEPILKLVEECRHNELSAN